MNSIGLILFGFVLGYLVRRPRRKPSHEPIRIFNPPHLVYMGRTVPLDCRLHVPQRHHRLDYRGGPYHG